MAAPETLPHFGRLALFRALLCAVAVATLVATAVARAAPPVVHAGDEKTDQPDAGGANTVQPDAGAAKEEGGEKKAGQDTSGEGDIVETIDTEAAATPSKPAPPPPKPDKFQFRGFARVTGGYDVYSLPPDPQGAAPQERVPLDRGIVEEHLFLELRYRHAGWFSAVVSGSLEVGEIAQQNQPSGGAPGSSFGYQRLEPLLREAYFGLSLDRFDLRIGQQRIAWGNSDAFAPNDVLNGRDLRNPLLFDNEMLVLPSPALRADLDMDFGTLGLVFEPFLVNDRVDIYGTNWAIVQPDAPLAYRRLFGTLAAGQDRSSVAGLQDSLTGGQLNPSNPVDLTAGASFRTHIGGIDMSYYLLSGYDHTPAIFVDPQFQNQLDQIDSTMLNGGVLDALLNTARASNTAIGGPIVVSYRRRSHLGMDAQTSIGSFVLRTDLAYDSAKTFYLSDSLNSVIRPTTQEVVGIEYQTGNFKRVITLEGWAMQILTPSVAYVPILPATPNGPLLWYQDQNYGVANLIRWSFFDDDWVFEMRSSVGAQPFWYLFRPEFGWDSSSLTIRAGFMGIGGDAGSLGYYYRRNSTAYLTTRLSF